MTVADATAKTDLHEDMLRLGHGARDAARTLAKADTETKNAALRGAAAAIREDAALILCANERDMEAARAGGLTGAFLDRLALDAGRVEAMAKGLEDIAGLADPVGQVIGDWTRPNGLRITRVRVPLGVIGVIYESRPNVTVDAAALCLKSGNAVILRGGSESFHSSRAIVDALHRGLAGAGLPESCAQLVPTTDRAAVGEMLSMAGLIDVIVPRGGKSLIKRVTAESRIPVIKHLDGICHVYVDGAAALDMARDIAVNAKMRRPGICGAAETLLVDRKVKESHLVPIVAALIDAGCEVRGDGEVTAKVPGVIAAVEADWGTEYLDAIISVRLVDGVQGAIAHIARYGSAHTDSIVTSDQDAARVFLQEVDSAIVLHNASTQFADGGEFGMGAEIGISTDKLHARGPVGVEQLTSYKYVVHGAGQTRP
ncbi:MAG: glutamate-5-semialdehyde dehydrogenase [Alphaproteobacteria bacterium]|nr:glutamate-5-semialdehyde dehydrogenase [Alphaproteobacteria bacterium]MCZ6610565.1 glutamate-5-semialdehyde dehydrogenase [Alphaproteobacteria bacterium]MCZ6742454.1 glutamate-5-semialdehyde dehydrogenase [Alphaproteobacteria bacterium]MCZ6848404.1 glutamate-5-semialdehyde dehydrogenase [Alphaproteobacteria bacterium]